MSDELRLSDAEATRLTAAWNEGADGTLTLTAALYALHIANGAIEWDRPVAKMIVTAALSRALPTAGESVAERSRPGDPGDQNPTEADREGAK